MHRRGFLQLVGLTSAGLALATTPELEQATRRFWPGWRATPAVAPTSILAGRDVMLYTAPWLAANALPIESPWGTPWNGDGATRDGLRFTMRLSRTNVHIDQVIDLHRPELLQDPIRRVPPRPSRARA
jgi:hypothetical protein